MSLYDAGWTWRFDGLRVLFDPRSLWVGVRWDKERPRFDGGWCWREWKKRD